MNAGFTNNIHNNTLSRRLRYNANAHDSSKDFSGYFVLIDRDDIKIIFYFSEMDEFLTIKSYLYSIFYNLISNSIRYRQPGLPAIIEIKSRLNNTLELIFTDNGMGIDLQKRGEQVFGLYKRFYTNIEGKGMGLFMVKTQVESLDGKINIRSQVNKGTEFKIEFQIGTLSENTTAGYYVLKLWLAGAG